MISLHLQEAGNEEMVKADVHGADLYGFRTGAVEFSVYHDSRIMTFTF